MASESRDDKKRRMIDEVRGVRSAWSSALDKSAHLYRGVILSFLGSSNSVGHVQLVAGWITLAVSEEVEERSGASGRILFGQLKLASSSDAFSALCSLILDGLVVTHGTRQLRLYANADSLSSLKGMIAEGRSRNDRVYVCLCDDSKISNDEWELLDADLRAGVALVGTRIQSRVGLWELLSLPNPQDIGYAPTLIVEFPRPGRVRQTNNGSVEISLPSTARLELAEINEYAQSQPHVAERHLSLKGKDARVSGGNLLVEFLSDSYGNGPTYVELLYSGVLHDRCNVARRKPRKKEQRLVAQPPSAEFPDEEARKNLERSFSGVWGSKVFWLALLTIFPLFAPMKLQFLKLQLSVATAVYAIYHILGIWLWACVNDALRRPHLYGVERWRAWRSPAGMHSILGAIVAMLLLLTFVDKLTLNFYGPRRVQLPSWVRELLGTDEPQSAPSDVGGSASPSNEFARRILAAGSSQTTSLKKADATTVLGPVAGTPPARDKGAQPGIMRLAGGGTVLDGIIGPLRPSLEDCARLRIERRDVGSEKAFVSLAGRDSEMIVVSARLQPESISIDQGVLLGGDSVVEVLMAVDEVAFFVNQENPLSSITFERLQYFLFNTGQKQWSALESTVAEPWNSSDIYLVLPRRGVSGTRRILEAALAPRPGAYFLANGHEDLREFGQPDMPVTVQRNRLALSTYSVSKQIPGTKKIHVTQGAAEVLFHRGLWAYATLAGSGAIVGGNTIGSGACSLIRCLLDDPVQKWMRTARFQPVIDHDAEFSGRQASALGLASACAVRLTEFESRAIPGGAGRIFRASRPPSLIDSSSEARH